MLLPFVFLLTGAHEPPPPSGELLLDAADPVIAVEIQKVPMRLRVDLDRQDSIELNPAAAARLPVKWEAGDPLDVGRTTLPTQVAGVLLTVDNRTLPAEVAQHGRDCCEGVDGVIGPDLLPYATVRWRNPRAPMPTGHIELPLEANENFGLSAPGGDGGIRARFALGAPDTIATAAAGSALARMWGGRWNGPEQRVTLIYDVRRPVRPMAFAHPGPIAGFPTARLLVRLSDFGGEAKLPTDPAVAGEVTIRHRLHRQQAWLAVTLGADRLSRCAEIAYTAIPRSLTLSCAFDAP